MRQVAPLFLLLFLSCLLYGQSDSIRIEAEFSQDLRTLEVNQTILYHNRQEESIKKAKLLNWIAAYRRAGTSLSKRKIEDRNKELHFSKNEDLGYLENLSVGDSLSLLNLNSEELLIDLPYELAPGESIELKLKYHLVLPKSTFTHYGWNKDQVLLKYFFLVSDPFYVNEEAEERHFNDTEQTQSGGNHWAVKLSLPENWYSESNLESDLYLPHEFSGSLKEDPEFLITRFPTQSIDVFSRYAKSKVVFGYPLHEKEASTLKYLFPVHFNFLGSKLGEVPKKILITQKFYDQEDFFGNDDIKFWKFKFEMFSDMEKLDLDYFSILSKKAIQESAVTRKSTDHWFKNGIQSYLEMQYLDAHYKDRLLLGDLPENAKILGIRPLKYLTAARLKLSERYGLAYQYMVSQNLDQKIGTSYPTLSNFNDMAISRFETGSLLNFISEKMGKEAFESFLKEYLQEHKDEVLDTKDFLDALTRASKYSSNFLENFIYKEHRVNFKVKKFEKLDEGYLVKIRKNTREAIPMKITSEDFQGETRSFWYDTSNKNLYGEYLIPRPEVKKILVNDEYMFPESNFRDNYLYTKGLFSNTKKIRLKLLRDIPNPEYNEIYIEPKLTFNAYDKVLLGIGFKNKSLFEQPFLYSIAPYFSTGTNSFTGSASATYTFRPPDAFFSSWQVGLSGSYFHYDHNLAYKKLSVSSQLNFSKVLRSDITRALYFSFSHYEKDLTPELIAQNEYDRYGLWSMGYAYSDRKIIHEISLGSQLQLMNDFQKLSAEASYRYEYAKNKKIHFRLFGGVFFSNNTRNDLFNFGIHRVSNYAFNYSLLGQSATSGVLSQQYIQAEGGMKSAIGDTVDQWISTFGVDAHLWKPFNIYADVGVYKNEGIKPQFMWDSGIKVKVIPDFLEIYLPVQSSLGFEPSLPDYAKRIRFTLQLNLSALTSHFRRGWY